VVASTSHPNLSDSIPGEVNTIV